MNNTLEDLVIKRLCDIVNYSLSKIIKPDIEIESVNSLDREALDKIKEKYGIEGVILDIDDTLREDMKSIPRCYEEWLETLKSELKVVVLSNGVDEKIQKFLQEKEISYIGFAMKPLKRSFKKACKIMNLPQDKVLVIGDSIFCDIHGGNRNNMKTVRINKNINKKKINESERKER